MLGVFNIFSKRQKKLDNDTVDVYEYESIPSNLKVQAIHIFREVIDTEHYSKDNIYLEIHKVLCKEYGVFTLKEYAQNNEEAIFDFLLKTNDYQKALDIIELFYRYFYLVLKEKYKHHDTHSRMINDAIIELNERFKENAIGYSFESGEAIKIDSKFIHSEVVKPTLKILNNSLYKGANEEFLKAHEHYRHKRYKECLNECLKSFESTMKTICDKHNWTYNQNDTSKKLIKICFDNNLIPTYLQTQFSSLQQLFESGVPTIRNKNSGHGQGVQPIQVTAEITSYMLHLTATNLLFLAEHEQQLT
ncbi:MAG: STM4504/CBY_0614 family protein [Candidatus Marinarcus sp.]|uniref:STM4504/CBY_0614 family protein n=1 Tax=Candidatus Marinarcus sp. TaxID=3100987 RepID=UPI003AFF9F1C